MQRKKLVIFCNDYGYFLAHRYQMFETLPAEGHEVVAWCGGSFPEKAASLAFPIRHYACDRYSFRPLLDLLLLVQMVIALIRERPDVVHTITMKPNVYGSVAVRLAGLISGRRPRLVMASPGLGRMFSGSPSGPRAASRRKLIVRVLRSGLSRNNSRAIFENEEDRDVWVGSGIVPRDRTHVIAGTGVDQSTFHPVTDRAPPPPLRILFGGRLLRSKGVLSFVEIARRAKREGKQAEFLVAGSHDPRDPDSVDPEKLDLPNNMSFLGHVSDMPALITTVHAILLPTVYAEGLPRILLEGAAMNCVLLASDIAGCRRAVIDGENGFILPVSNNGVDIALACEKIRLLSENPDLVATMSGKSLAHFEENRFDTGSVRTHVRDILFGEAA